MYTSSFNPFLSLKASLTFLDFYPKKPLFLFEYTKKEALNTILLINNQRLIAF